MLRILHTADWHLGHHLHTLPREREHDAFVAWLLDTLDRLEVDALVVAGDVFDSSNPPAAAQALWFRFLGAAARRRPGLDVVVVGGNHDSAARLDAPHPVLAALGVSVVGGLPRLPGGAVDHDRLVVPLHDRDGQVGAWVAAVPFLRASDLPAVDDGEDRLVEGVRAVYAAALAAARERRSAGQALLATGHCYMTGTLLSELSERKVLGGNQHALPVDIFADDVAYVALGHLHLAQAVGRDCVRYAGSPIPLSLSEADYRHQVRLIDIEGGAVARLWSEPVPRTVGILRIPADGPLPVEEVLPLLAALPDGEIDDAPYLEVRVRIPRPDPSLRARIEDALAGKAVRLARIGDEQTGHGRAMADDQVLCDLRDLAPEEVFVRRYQRDYEGEPSPALLASFHELIDQVEADR